MTREFPDADADICLSKPSSDRSLLSKFPKALLHFGDPYASTESRHARRFVLRVCSSVSDVFAIAKVMLFASLIMMLLAKARSDVMFAHCAEGTTSFTQ